jgi:hypothetical protein
MRRSAVLFLTGLVIALSACFSNDFAKKRDSASDHELAGTAPSSNQAQMAAGNVAASATMKSGPQQEAVQQQVSLESAAAAQAAEHKVIKNAEITIETDTPEEGQQKIGVIAEKQGGFVITSESKQNEAVSQNVASTVINMVVRVPARQFEAAVAEIRGVGNRVPYYKSSGQDVTEEYIDLEARIRTKRSLESQFMEIMKQARNISDALEVQAKLADVRTEIERLEGRRRFLENQSALSTIKITLQTSTPVVAAATRGFLYDLKSAFTDGIEFGTGIFLGVIRFVIVMIPLTLFILAPGWFVFKWTRKRFTWPVKQAAASVTSQTE